MRHYNVHKISVCDIIVCVLLRFWVSVASKKTACNMHSCTHNTCINLIIAVCIGPSQADFIVLDLDVII